MSVKKSQLETKVVPIVQGLMRSGVRTKFSMNSEGTSRCDNFVGAAATEIVSSMYGNEGAAKQHRVVVTTLSSEASQLLKTEASGAKTFSFNILMEQCENLSCYEIWGVKSAVHGRPAVPVFRGKSPGFCVFVHGGEVLAAVNMYHTNFLSWAERIGLRKSMKSRTSLPSTHYVYVEEAIRSGLLWFNPKLEWL